MEKYQVIGLVILVVVTFFMINSDQVFAVSTYQNSTSGNCVIGGFDFTCPLDMSNITSASVFPKRIAGVGTDNGYFTMWQQNVTSTDLRLFYASTKDGITGTTPLDITGQLGGCPSPCLGIDEDQMFIFEDNGTIDLFWLEIADGVQQSSSEIFHARSTNGGTSFTKTSIVLDAPFYFPIVDSNTLAIAYKDTNFNRMAFRISTNGGTSFGSEILIDGGSDECNEPKHPIQMTKVGSDIHVAWYGLNAQNTSNNALCYNQSTDGGTSWSSSVQILSEQVFSVGDRNEADSGSTIFPNEFPVELEIYVDTVTSPNRINIIWENTDSDIFFNALSTDNGISFGNQTRAFDTGSQDSGCTDPLPLGKSWGIGDVGDYVGSDIIYISCTGNPVNWAIKRTVDHGQTWTSAQTASDDVSGGRFIFADDPLGFATTGGAVFAVSENTNPDQMQFVFSEDFGVNYNNSTTMFMTSDTPRAMTGNNTHVWIGFQHSQDFGESNAWVSLFETGVTLDFPTGITTTDTLFGCDSPAGSGFEKIFQLNKTDGSEISNQTMTLSGFTVEGCNGMAVDPTDGTFYVILQEQAGGGFDRRLATIDPTTGVATDIGGMGDRFATLGFKADGTLLTVAGQGASFNQNHLFSVNKSTGATTLLCSLVAGVTLRGQTLGLNYDDGKLYHHTGDTVSTDRFATIGSQAVATCSTTDLGAVTGFSFGELRAMAYNTNDELFYATGGNTDDFFSLQDSGFATLITVDPFTLGERLKGLAFTLAVADTDPVITILGDNPVQHLINTTYNDGGATCLDSEDGTLTSSIVTIENVNTTVLGSGTVTYTCTDSDANLVQVIRTVNVVEQITTTTTTGGAVGAPVSGTVDTGIEGLTPEQILAFDQAVADAIASIEPSEGNIIETIIQTFFEFTIVDKVHDELRLQSFLDDERLGFRWSTGGDIVIVSATPALSPFMFTFEQFPVVRQGSGAFVSTNFILYNLEVPRTECGATITMNCVEKIRYEIPVTVNAIINGTQVSSTGTITVDLTEDAIDPILLIILSTLAIPIIGVIIQRSRGRSSVEAVRRLV